MKSSRSISRWIAGDKRPWATASAACLLLAGCDSAQGPDVIVIVIDTLRADHVGVLGAGTGRTPVLDELAAEGVVFEQCYSAYPLTLPSIATMLSSQWPHVHRVRENYEERLSDRATTLTEVLDGAGYRTGGFVSSLPVRRETGCAQGFDVYDDDFSEPFVFHREQFERMAPYWTGSERRGDQTVERALTWYRKQKGPTFLFVHLFDPHSPYDPPEPHATDQPTSYAGEVAFSDELVGRVVDAVRGKARGGADPPLVAVISDHGEGLGEHEEWAHGFFLYDATIHVPWILWSPGRVPVARVTPLVRTLDLAPTIADALGLVAPPEWAGRSTLPLAVGESAAPRDVFAENWFTRREYGWSELAMWVTPDWKWVEAPRPELYDRTRDSRELDNLAGARAEVAAARRTELDAFRQRSLARADSAGVNGLADEINPEPRVREWLQNLGYIGSGGDTAEDGPRPDPKDEVPRWNQRRESRTHAANGRRFLEAGDVPLALTAFENAVAAMPTSEALRGLGMTLIALDRHETARRHLRAALDQSPNDVETLRGYAIVLDVAGEMGRADSVLHRATLLDSTRSELWHHRADVSRRRGDTDQAMACYERVLALDPDAVDAIERYAALCLAAGRPARAVELYTRLHAKRPWDPVAGWRLGLAQAAAGDSIGARTTLASAREQAGRGALGDSIDVVLRELP